MILCFLSIKNAILGSAPSLSLLSGSKPGCLFSCWDIRLMARIRHKARKAVIARAAMPRFAIEDFPPPAPDSSTESRDSSGLSEGILSETSRCSSPLSGDHPEENSFISISSDDGSDNSGKRGRPLVIDLVSSSDEEEDAGCAAKRACLIDLIGVSTTDGDADIGHELIACATAAASSGSEGSHESGNSGDSNGADAVVPFLRQTDETFGDDLFIVGGSLMAPLLGDSDDESVASGHDMAGHTYLVCDSEGNIDVDGWIYSLRDGSESDSN